MGIPLSFHIDVSGQPTEAIFVGLCSIKPDQMTNVIKKIKRERPEFLRHKFKGSNLRPNEISSYVRYLNGQGIRMVCCWLKSAFWKDLKKYLEKKKYWKELVYSALYFATIKKYSKYGDSYPVVTCYESYLDIEKVKQYLKKIGKAHGIIYNTSSTYASQDDFIKIADIVAAAGRKVRPDLKDLEYFEFISPTIDEIKFYLAKVI